MDLPFPVMSTYLAPNFISQCLSSGWKRMIRASTPTSMKVLRMAFIRFMLRAATMTLRMNTDMIAMNMFMAAVPLIHLNTR